MYFYTHKINKNEQNILLEMRDNTCFHFGNGSGLWRIISVLC
jgi:hypothetical protein